MKSIDVQWGNDEKNVILITNLGPWTWEDYDRSLYEAAKLVRTVDHPVDFISDWRKHPQPPTSNALGHIKKVTENTPPNAGKIICVGYPFFLKVVMEISHRVFPWQGGLPDLVSTLDEAWTLVHKYQDDRKLRDLEKQAESRQNIVPVL